MLITVDYNNDRNDNIGTNDLQVSLLRKKIELMFTIFLGFFFPFLFLFFSVKIPFNAFSLLSFIEPTSFLFFFVFFCSWSRYPFVYLWMDE